MKAPEYSWIMRLTKLTTTSITAARLIQFTANSIGAPPPGTMPATKSKANAEKTSEIVTPRMATYWALSFRRRPNRASTKKTSAGSAGMAVMISCWPTVCTCLPLSSHGGYFVYVHRPPRAEHGEHYSKSDGDLCGRYGDNEHRVADPETSRAG